MRAALLLLVAVTTAPVPELDRMLSRWKPVRMPFEASTLSPRERQIVEKLATASQYLDEIYWRQRDPQGLELLASLANSRKPLDEKLRRLLIINGCRYDLIDGNKPFAGSEPYYPGGGLYARGLTREDIEKYVRRHPDKRAEIYSPYTVVRRRGTELVGVPYHVEYRAQLEPAARALRETAELSSDPQFARFLRLRADALLNDGYYASDIAWLDLRDPKIDVIFAPYETYDDGILGVKTSYGAAVLIRNEAESRRLSAFVRSIPELQEALPLAAEDKPSKRGRASPMEVCDSPFRAGDLRHGYQAVADNLPNDPKIHQEKGSKKIFFKNFLDARVENIIIPLAQRLMPPEQAALVTPQGYLEDTLLHEISHGLGPAFARVNGKQADIRESIGPLESGLEEAKADVVGLFGLAWLAQHGAIPKDHIPAAYAAHVADLFRMLRFGAAEAHAVSEIMQFNYFVAQGAITARNGRYAMEATRMATAVESLAKELLEIEATGDRARAERLFATYRALPPGLDAALAKAADVPVDIDPIFSFPNLPR